MFLSITLVFNSMHTIGESTKGSVIRSLVAFQAYSPPYNLKTPHRTPDQHSDFESTPNTTLEKPS